MSGKTGITSGTRPTGPTALPGKGQHGPGRPDKRSRLARRARIGVLLLSVLYGVAWWIAADRVEASPSPGSTPGGPPVSGSRRETSPFPAFRPESGCRSTSPDGRWTVGPGGRSSRPLHFFQESTSHFRLRIESDTPITVRQGPIDGAPNAEARVARWTQAITLRPLAGPERLLGTASDVVLAAKDPSGALRDIARVETMVAKMALADPATVGPDDIGATLSFKAEGASSAAAAFPVTDRSGFASVDLSIRGPVPAIHPRALVDWRDAGGVVEIERVRVDWTPIRVEADGTVALDEGLQPIGAGTAEIRGLEGVLDRLADSGSLDRRAAGVAKIIVALFMTDQKDGAPVVRLPLAFRTVPCRQHSSNFSNSP